MAEYVATVGSEKVPPSADLNVARSLARQNPAEAFAWAGRLPPERGLAAAREVLAADAELPYTLREATGGRHVSVTLVPTVQTGHQVLAIYRRMQLIVGLVMLL